jgi:4-hydroxythreonine-4-phosphate dehydrogenase
MSQRRKAPPLIAVSMGDPAGIGAEVIVKSAARLAERRGAPSLLVFGDLGAIRAAAARLKNAPQPRPWNPGDVPFRVGAGLSVYSPEQLPATAIRPGHPTVEGANSAYHYIVGAARMAMRGEADAIVTAPINKQWMNRAGHHFPGHSELLAKLAHARDWRMMFAGGDLTLALVTVHVGLAQVPAMLTQRNILGTIRLLAEHLRSRMNVAKPRIGVLGFNPHAGEGGLFGDEEIRVIAPAIKRAQGEGIDAVGPLSPDTAFIRPTGSFGFDAAVSMYHDQGLIALKTLEFDRAVNVTLGLPFIRTSPDHGTAFDIAGKNVANESSMMAALEYASRAATRREASPRHAAA